MKKLLIFLCLLFISGQLYPQNNLSRQNDESAQTHINIYYTPQLYFNKTGIFNDGNAPDVLSTKNTLGYNLGLDYERITRQGIILNVGFHYGKQKHTVDVNYKGLAFFDPSEAAYLNQFNLSRNFKGTMGYIGMKFMAGYQWQIPRTILKHWQLEAKAGFALRLSISGGSDSQIWSVQYQKEDSTFIGWLADGAANFGNERGLASLSWSHNAEVYLGLSKPINYSFIKNLSVGVCATYGIGKKYRGIGDVLATSYNYHGERISEDEYRTQDFSLGIRLALGLWYK